MITLTLDLPFLVYLATIEMQLRVAIMVIWCVTVFGLFIAYLEDDMGLLKASARKLWTLAVLFVLFCFFSLATALVPSKDTLDYVTTQIDDTYYIRVIPK